MIVTLKLKQNFYSLRMALLSCIHCNKTFKKKNKCDQHSLDSRCCLCDRREHCDTFLELHIKTEHSDIFTDRSISNMESSNKRKADRSLKSNKKKTVKMSLEKNKTNLIQKEKKKKIETKTIERNFQCQHCDHKAANPSTLSRHQHAFHNIQTKEALKFAKRIFHIEAKKKANHQPLDPNAQPLIQPILDHYKNVGDQLKTPQFNDMSIACPHCKMLFKKVYNLGEHIDRDHMNEINNYHKLVKMPQYHQRIEANEKRSQFNERRDEVDIFVKEDAKFDYNRRFWLRLTKCHFQAISKTFSDDTPHLEQCRQKVEEWLSCILPNFSIKVVGIKIHNEKKDVYDVCFDDKTNMKNLFEKLEDYCQTFNRLPETAPDQKKTIEVLLKPETKVRLEILKDIGKWAVKDTKKSFHVKMYNYRPQLQICNNDYYPEAHVQDELWYTFSEACIRFGKTMKPEQFFQSKRLFQFYNFKASHDLHKFLIHM